MATFLGAPTKLNDIEDTGFCVPDDRYQMAFFDPEVKENKKRNGHFLVITNVIQGGPHDGAKIFTRFNFDNPNADAVRIAQQELKQLCLACGCTGDEDLTLELIESLVGTYYQADTKTDSTPGQKPRSEILAFVVPDQEEMEEEEETEEEEEEAPEPEPEQKAPPKKTATKKTAKAKAKAPAPSTAAAPGKKKNPWDK